MTKELNTLAPKKYPGNYGGTTPTLDSTDGILVGDFAIDTSTDPVTIWQCLNNSEATAYYLKLTDGLLGYTNVIYVDNGRLDGYTEDGTANKPFKTIHDAIHAGTGASALLIGPGVYEEDITIEEDSVLIGVTSCTSAEIRTTIKGKTTVQGNGITVNLIAIELQNDDDLCFEIMDCERIVAKDCTFNRTSANTDPCISIANVDTTCHIRGGKGMGVCTLTTVDSKLTLEGFHGENMSILASEGTLTGLSSFLGDVTNVNATVRLYSCPILNDIVSNGFGTMYITNASMGNDIAVSSGVVNVDIQNLAGYITHSGGVLVVTNLQNINGDDGSGNAVVSTAEGGSVLAIVDSNIQDFTGTVKKINKSGDCFYILQSRRNLADDVINGTRLAYYSYDLDVQNTSTVTGASVKDALNTLGSSAALKWQNLTEAATAEINKGYLLAGTFTLTLPLNPTIGDPIGWKVLSGVITLGRNGQKIEGVEDDMVLNIVSAGGTFVFQGAEFGWVNVTEIGAGGSGGSIDTATLIKTMWAYNG